MQRMYGSLSHCMCLPGGDAYVGPCNAAHPSHIPIGVHLREYVPVRLSASVCFPRTSFTGICDGTCQVGYVQYPHTQHIVE